MRRTPVSENRQMRGFHAACKHVSAETRASARLEENSDAIFAFIPSFSDLP